jgi:hypothetical protein
MPSGIFDKNWHCYDQPTLYSRLQEKDITWKIYHHGMPQTMVMITAKDRPTDRKLSKALGRSVQAIQQRRSRRSRG